MNLYSRQDGLWIPPYQYFITELYGYASSSSFQGLCSHAITLKPGEIPASAVVLTVDIGD